MCRDRKGDDEGKLCQDICEGREEAGEKEVVMK